MKGGVVMDVTGLKIFVFINAMIFAFITFVTNTPLWGKTLLKYEKEGESESKIMNQIFGRLQHPKMR